MYFKNRRLGGKLWRTCLAVVIGLQLVLGGLFTSGKPAHAAAVNTFVSEIRLFPFNRGIEGWIYCAGQELNPQAYPGLYSVLGTRFGGNGVTTFNLPDLRGYEPVKGTGYYISAEGYPILDADFGEQRETGEVRMFPFATDSSLNGWLPANGNAVSKAAYPDLYNFYGDSFGSPSSSSVFYLPNLSPFLADNNGDLSIRYYVSASQNPPAVPQYPDYYTGELVPFPKEWPASPWVKADGGTLPLILENQGLYTLLFEGFGGNGTDFNLPDLTSNAQSLTYYLVDEGAYPLLPNDSGLPSLSPDNYTMTPNGNLTVDRQNGVLANDTKALTAKIVDPAGHGLVQFAIDGSFKYTPATNFIGTDSFTYIASNNNGSSGKVTVSIQVGEPAPAFSGVTDGASYNRPVTIQFENGTGKLNGASIVSGHTVSSEGSYNLVVTSLSGILTAEARFMIDTTPPDIIGVTDGSSYNTDVAIIFNEGMAKLDGGSFTSGDIVRSEGTHTLVVTDAAGNKATVTFTIDKTAPVVMGVTNGGLYNQNVQISFTEGTAKLNGNNFTSGSTVSSEGMHTLVVTDAAGNKTTVTFTIDKTPPIIIGVTDGSSYNTDVAIIFTEGTAKLDGGTFTSGELVRSEGTHTLVVSDAAGNKTTVTFTIDKTAPVVIGVTDGSLYNRNVQISFTEGTAKLNGNNFTSGSTVSSDGSHTLVVTDAAGNKTTVTFTIDKTAPTVTGVTDGGMYNSEVTITFDEGTAELDNNTFASGDKVSAEGPHTLVVTDAAGNKTTVTFSIYYQRVVSFESNGGSPVADQMVNYGGTVSPPADPVKDGFAFVGWFADQLLGMPFDFSQLITNNLTLYAKWKDSVDPTLSAHSPVSGTRDVGVYPAFELEFSEPVSAVAGKEIRVYKNPGGILVETLSADDPSKVSGSGASYAFRLGQQLDYNTEYYVEIDAGAFRDAEGNEFSGLSGPQAWNFTTEREPIAPPVAPTDVTAEPGDGKVVVNWSTVTGATYYDVYQGIAPGVYEAEPIFSVTEATYTVSGLTNGTTYYFAVKAGNDGGSSSYSNEAAATPSAPSLPGDADLSGLLVSGGTLKPAFDPVTTNYTVNVPYMTTSITITPTVSDPGALIKINGKEITAGSASEPILLKVGVNPVEIVIEAQNGDTKTYRLLVTREKETSSPNPNPNPGTGSGSSGGGASSGAASEGSTAEPAKPKPLELLVNGRQASDRLVKVTEKQDQSSSVWSAYLDTAELARLLESTADGKTLRFSYSGQADTIEFVLNGEAMKMLDEKMIELILQTPIGNYHLPVSQMRTDPLDQAPGTDAWRSTADFTVTIAKGSASDLTRIQQASMQGGFKAVGQPVEFSLKVSYEGETVSIERFNGFVTREIPILAGLRPDEITTAVVLHPDGTVRPVPTGTVAREGVEYAVIRSLTNSTYALVQNSVSFTDMDGQWSAAAVTDLASRMVLRGADQNRYLPDQAVTRAEFAAILVRALGLEENEATGMFKDISPDAWYAGAVAKASEYGLIQGYDGGFFQPSKTITREEALVMITRAMKIAGVNQEISTEDAGKALSGYTDHAAVGDWARLQVAVAVEQGLANGNGGKLLPDAEITRAETAAIVQRLLIRAGLIGTANDTVNN